MLSLFVQHAAHEKEKDIALHSSFLLKGSGSKDNYKNYIVHF